MDVASVETNATGSRSFTLSLSCALARETPKKVEKVPATADVDALSTVVSACVSIPCEDLVWFFFLCGFCAILVCHALRLGFREGSRGCRVCFTRCISRMGGCVNLGGLSSGHSISISRSAQGSPNYGEMTNDDHKPIHLMQFMTVRINETWSGTLSIQNDSNKTPEQIPPSGRLRLGMYEIILMGFYWIWV